MEKELKKARLAVGDVGEEDDKEDDTVGYGILWFVMQPKHIM